MIKGVNVKAGYRRAAAGVMGCLLVGGTLSATLKQGQALPVTSGESHSAASLAALAWEPDFSAVQPRLDPALQPVDMRMRREKDMAGNMPTVETYTVQPGDSVWSIADAHDTDTDTILSLNETIRPEALQPGQTLQVVRAFHGMTYSVQVGDTLQGVARQFGVGAEQIRLANNLGRVGDLKIGDLLFVPGARPEAPTRTMLASRSGLVRRDTAPAAAASVAARPAAPAPAPAQTVAAAPPPPRPAAAPAASGGYIWPISGGLHTSEYGPRWGTMHEGLDIAVPSGTTAVAAKGGTVTFAGWDGGYGYQVIIDHGDGTRARYAHASALLVGVGTVVEQGQAIIKVGSTGNSTGPHLHFEIHVNGKAVNPRAYLP